MTAMIKKLFLLLLFTFPFAIAVHAQDAGGQQPKSPPTSKAQRRQAKAKWKEERLKKREEKKKIKEHHKRIQSKATLKRMKKDARKSKRVNEHKREFFLKRWFGK
jgi:hypothetical protein